MKIAIELYSILVALNAALALQAIYAAQQRELHELHKQGFGAGLHPRAETVVTGPATSPGFGGTGTTDSSARVA